MQEIQLTTQNSSSQILIESGLLAHIDSYIDSNKYDTIFCLVDSVVDTHYRLILDATFDRMSNIQVKFHIIEASEEQKTLATIQKILEDVSAFECTKRTLFVAIGGGIVCDMGGLVAGLWYRGCNALYVPTTLLSMVDASVGGKCGVDFEGHKNQIGLIIQPKQVLIDPLVLGTLPADTFMDGCAEIIKHACLKDPDMLDELQAKPLVKYSNSHIARFVVDNKTFEVLGGSCSYNPSELDDLIARNIQIKASFVQTDEFDTGIRAALNYGHTAGHAYESACDMQVSHGKAVARGIIFANKFAISRGYTDSDYASKVEEVLHAHGLCVPEDQANVHEGEAILETKNVRDRTALNIAYDKKATAQSINFIFVRKPGDFTILKIAISEIQEAILSFF